MMAFSINELADKEDGFIDVGIRVHTAEVDRLAGKVIKFMFDEMPGDLTTSAGVEVLLTALWWVQTAAFVSYAKKTGASPHVPTRWEQAMQDRSNNDDDGKGI